MINSQLIIDRAIQKRSQVRGSARDLTFFHISDSGTCYRKRYMKRLGVEPIIPIPTASLRKMLAGDAGHEMLQELLRNDGALFAYEQKVGNEDIKGHHDGIIKTEGGAKVLLEFKTVEKWAMSHITGSCTCSGDKAHDYGPKPEHKLQMFTYWRFLRTDYKNLDQASLVYIKREDFGAKQFDFLWDESFNQIVIDEWLPLLKYWAKQELPPCTCHLDYGGNGVKYCRYKNEDETNCCMEELINSIGAGGGVSSEEKPQIPASRPQAASENDEAAIRR